MPVATSSRKSTIVRTSPVRLTALRTTFRALDRVAPAVAGRWALGIWCTPPASAGRRRDNRPAPGHRSKVELEGGRQLAVETWAPQFSLGVPASPGIPSPAAPSAAPATSGITPTIPGTTPDSPSVPEQRSDRHATARPARTVYLVHGWGGWRGQLGAFVTPLVQAGFRVVAFDAPSHGDSSPGTLGPGRATALDFTEALVAVAATHGRPDGIVAHSMGAATTTLALRDGLPVERLVFVAPGPDPIGTTEHLERVLGYGRRTRQRFFSRLERMADRPLSDFNAFTIDPRAELPPALVIHDRHDKESPYDDGVRLAEIWPEAELVSTDGLGHQRILLDDTVIGLTVDYLR